MFSHCLKHQAEERGGIELIMIGDGAEICGAKSASQTAIGFKMVCDNAMDPMNPDRRLTYDTLDNNGCRVYRNVQSMNNCYVTRISLCNKMKEMVDVVMRPQFE